MKEPIHFSDGEKPICGDEGAAVADAQNVTCKKCQVFINAEAVKQNDPIVRATIFDQDLKPGQDFNFTYERKHYHGISGAIHRIPKSVAIHLRDLSYPVSAYKEGQESGQSIVVVGDYHRFIVNIIEELGAEIGSEKESDVRTFKVGDPVIAEGYPGKITKIEPDGMCEVGFDDGDGGCYAAEDLTPNQETAQN